MRKPQHTTDPLLVLLTTALVIGLFVLDLWLPLGVADGVLYGSVVLISLTSPQRQFPCIVAGVCSALTVVGAFLGPTLPSVPPWIVVINRALGLIVIWVPALVFRERRRGDEALRRAYGELEIMVQQRTAELLKSNRALAAEVTERTRAEESLMESQHALENHRRQLSALAAQLLTAQEEDRRRISRELHDDINQRLAMLAVEAESIEQTLPCSPELIRERLQSIRKQVVALSDDVRHIAYQFHPSILDDLGLPTALRRYVDDFTARTGIEAAFVCRNLALPLAQDISLCLYRVAQESLGNVARHASTSEVAVELYGSDGGISLSVRDSGAGFDLDDIEYPHAGLGLTSMRERVRVVSGRLEVRSRPGEGTEVRVWIPLSESNA